MTAYLVTRAGRTIVGSTVGTESTAVREARETLEETLSALDDDDETVVDWAVGEGTIDEHPVAPFDPFRIEVAFTVTVRVEAADEAAAAARGTEAIADALSAVGVVDRGDAEPSVREATPEGT